MHVQAKDYVREIQTRLIVQPVMEQLLSPFETGHQTVDDGFDAEK
jgi:hypothetical protein